MVTTEELRAAAHKVVDEADDDTLISILEIEQKNEAPVLSADEMERILASRQRRIDGEKGRTLEEIFIRREASKANGSL